MDRRTLVWLCVAWMALAQAACTDRADQVLDVEPDGAAAGRAPASGAGSAHVAGRILVRFAPGADRAAVAAAHGASLGRELLLPGVWLVHVPAGRELSSAAALARNPSVRFAEPDWIRVFDDQLCTHCDRPNDELTEWKWDLHNDGDVVVTPFVMRTGQVDADTDWLEAYDYLGTAFGGSARIGIVDSGIRATHEDLCGKVVAGHDFVNGDADASDDHGHGTHVAGIAAACADNGHGAMGMAYGTGFQVVAAKVCAADGSCASSAIAEGITWAVDQGAHVVNLSLGGPDASTAEREALQYALANGALPICAAGNDGTAAVLYPARFPECMAVSATNWSDGLASYSSYGPEVEVAAPGGDLEDLFLGTSFIVSTYNASDRDYVQSAGTSMAAPQVTGLAAVLHALGLTASQIRSTLQSTADDLGAAGRDDAFGYGRINAHQAVLAAAAGGGSEPPPPPPPPAAITLSARGYKAKGKYTADLAWSGATSTRVDVLRDGAKIATTANDGAHTDSIGRRSSGSYTYQICEAGTSTCSNEATVAF